MRLETLCVHAGTEPDPATGAIAPPIHLSTTFERDEDGEFRRGFKYARDLNPTRQALERAMAVVEGGAASLAFGSGQAATSAVFQALRPGDHVILPDSVYYGTPKLVQELFAPWGLAHTTVALDDLAAVRAAVRDNTRVIWVETPSNPLLTITDIAGVAAIARSAGARVVVDNTWATPVGQRPLELGADIAMHASTKYLGGHGDVLAGVVATSHAWAAELRKVRILTGAVLHPMAAYMLHRGLPTLTFRVLEAQARAVELAKRLRRHPAIERVHFPDGEGDDPRGLVGTQMSGPGSVIAFEVRGGFQAARLVMERVKLITPAVSLGSTDTLIEQPAALTHRVCSASERAEGGIGEGLLRLAVGLEHVEDLWADLDRALDVGSEVRAAGRKDGVGVG